MTADMNRSQTLPPVLQMPRTHSNPPPVEATRVYGSYALPVAAPELVGSRPEISDDSSEVPPAVLNRLFRAGDQSFVLFLSTRFGWWSAFLLVATFLVVDSSRYVCDQWAFTRRGHSAFILAQALVFAQAVASSLSSIIITCAVEGVRGLKRVFYTRELFRCLPISVGFALSQAAISHAFCQGLGAAVAVALGYLYMPMCALLSRWIFRRRYGWLEMYALAMITLSSLTFAEMRSRAISLSEDMSGAFWVLISVVFSVASSLFGEWVLKPKYNHGNTQPVYIQKARLEIWCIITSAVILRLLTKEPVRETFNGWDYRMSLSLAFRVAQSWMAIILAKQLSTLAKAVLQCLSLIFVFFIGNVLLLQQGAVTNPVICLLAVVVALSALLYQMGRQRTSQIQSSEGGREWHPRDQIRGESRFASNTPARFANGDVEGAPGVERCLSDVTEYGVHALALLSARRLISVNVGDFELYVQDVQALAPQEFLVPSGHLRPRMKRWRFMPRLVDRTWLEQARVVNTSLADWALSRAGVALQAFCLAMFVFSDASRTIINEVALGKTGIVQQSAVVMVSASSIVVGSLMAAWLDGLEGVRIAVAPRESLRYLPVSAVFSLGTTCQLYAYSLGMSAVQNTVIGYAYMPLSAVLSRFIFRRAYTGLEWLALLLLVLCAIVFVLLENSSDEKSELAPTGVACVLASVIFSCLGSLLAEKLMKASTSAFYIQKVQLEIGGLATAVVMLFVVGSLSDRQADAFWKQRDVGHGRMESGFFAGWSEQILLVLLATLLQSWLGGLVAKRLSTVIRAVAQCFSLLLIYFVGDLILKGFPFDWTQGTMAVVVAITIQVFVQAGRSDPSGTVELSQVSERAANAVQAPGGHLGRES